MRMVILPDQRFQPVISVPLIIVELHQPALARLKVRQHLPDVPDAPVFDGEHEVFLQRCQKIRRPLTI